MLPGRGMDTAQNGEIGGGICPCNCRDYEERRNVDNQFIRELQDLLEDGLKFCSPVFKIEGNAVISRINYIPVEIGGGYIYELL